MTRITTIAGALLATTGLVHAAPLDRSGQSVEDIVFAEGNYVELRYSHVDPDVTGVCACGSGSGEVAEPYDNLSFGMKYQLDDRISVALIYDQPFGTDISYEPSLFTLAGSEATLGTHALTGIVKYQFNENVSVFGGLRAQELSASAVVPLLAYTIDADADRALGYVAGIAYERPDIALRVALTYNSAIEHELDTTETFFGGPSNTVLEAETPQSVNLEAQSGIAADTLLFGSIRWVDYSEFTVSPPTYAGLTGAPLVDYDNDLWFFSLGVGRAVTDKLSVAVSAEYLTQEQALVSPLSPSDGRVALGIGGTYEFDSGLELGVGIRHVWLGNAEIGVAGTKVADFEDNSAWAAGVSIGYSF